MNEKNSVIASKNQFFDAITISDMLNTTAAARKKFDGGVTGPLTTSTSWKFDSVSWRNSTVPGSIVQCLTIVRMKNGENPMSVVAISTKAF